MTYTLLLSSFEFHRSCIHRYDTCLDRLHRLYSGKNKITSSKYL